ncbi:MAG TPA: hypothetical protein QGH10_18870, partial [Armatimonadota bacterium]|nr:hypothetical protein [Armatimonadota bacterium]
PYRVKVSVADNADGREFDSDAWRVTVTDEPVELRTSYIDEHNRLIRDGEPFFPLGMYWSSVTEDQLIEYADSSFNCLMPYDAPDEAEMDLVDEHGLKVIYSVKDIYHGHIYSDSGIETIEDERAFIADKAERFRNHPAMLAWYLNDELGLEYMDRLEAHQEWLEELDPHHPTWVVLYQVGLLGEYVRTFDAIGTDPYPIPTEPTRRAATWTQMTVDAVEDTRAVWQVPQVFNWANYKKTEEEKAGLRPPTLPEMRSMTWQCIAHGAKGLIYYSWFDIKRDTVVPFDEQWGYVKEIAAEVEAMIPVILSVEPTPEITARERTWLHWTVRKHQGTTYLIAVNDDDRAHEAPFELPDGTRLEIELEPHGVVIGKMKL